MHCADTREQQCVASSRQSCPRGDDIVDEQHTELLAPSSRPKRRTLQPLRPRMARLRSPMAAVEQPPARHSQLGSHSPGQKLRLVVPACPGPSAAGGCPRHHVDLADPQTAHHHPRKLAGNLSAIAVLQAMYNLSCHTLERQCGHDAGLADLRRCAGEREATAVTQRGAGLITTGAKGGEDHGAICTRRVLHGFR